MTDWELIEQKLIKGEESCVLHPYQDTQGYWTIGWGHHDDTIRSDTPAWSQEHADEVFDEDFEDAETTARSLCVSFSGLSGPRQGALTAMAFQLGYTAMSKFVNTLHAIDQDDFATAAAGIRNSLWAKQTPARARRIANRIETGQYE